MSRRRISSSHLLGAALVLLIVAMALLQTRPDEDRAYDPGSTGTYGLRGLVLWLESMGYTVDDRIRSRFVLEDEADLVMLFPVGPPIGDADAHLLRNWVASGGTLVIVGPSFGNLALVDTFGVDQELGIDLSGGVRQAQPLLPEMPARWPDLTPVRGINLDEAPSAVPVYADGQRNPLVAVQRVGRGVVWHLSPDLDLTNVALRSREVAALVPAILRTVPTGGLVRLHTLLADESAGPPTSTSLRNWVLGTPGGWAILFAAGTVLLFLVLQGRRLGPPLDPHPAARRREAAEYVEAMAALRRRAHQRRAVARHHRQRLLLAVGRPYHLGTDLSSRAFVEQVRLATTDLSPEQIDSLAGLLHDFDQAPDEGRLVRLVQAADAFVDSLPNSHAR